MKLFLKIVFISFSMALLAACGSSFEWFPSTITANSAPVANAGAAQSVIVTDTVALDGSASKDADSDPLTYSWSITSKPSGSTATLSGATAVKPTFTADVAGTYILSLTVNDGKTASTNAATVTITAFTSPPVANAGADQTVVAGTIVTLDGSGSRGANLSYIWRFVTKPPNAGAVVLSSATVVNPTFTPTIAGTYEIDLIVTDRLINSQADTVIVTVTPNNVGSVTVTW